MAKAKAVESGEQDINASGEHRIRVRAIRPYKNGTLIQGLWRAGEVREVTLDLYRKLRQDLPDNWEIVIE